MPTVGVDVGIPLAVTAVGGRPRGRLEPVGPKGVEYELLLALAAASIALTGPGRYALDRFVPGVRDHRLGYGIVGIVLAVLAAGGVLLVRS